MFNGLIRELGRVKSFVNNTLLIEANYTPNIGDSIAINGACLTVTKVLNNAFEVEVSPETQQIIAIENYFPNKLVHIEPALRFGDRIDGHLIQGHIDDIGEILEIKKNKNSYDVIIKVKPSLMKFIAKKGSIAVDGVSLTINEVFSDRFRLTIIPHTFNNTLFKYYKVHQRVNIETDLFAKYIYNMLKKEKKDESILAWW